MFFNKGVGVILLCNMFISSLTLLKKPIALNLTIIISELTDYLLFFLLMKRTRGDLYKQ